jgi:class 3 adenylate cyclase/pimeloyl-ACP methyl ester carboxylesterase
MVSEIPKTRWAKTVDGASIAYQDFGAGPLTLVVIHGWVSHVEVYWEWPGFARFMHRLARNLRIIHFDKRGTGLSDRVSGPVDIGVRMDDIRAVMDAAGVKRAALFGWCLGGPPLALVFASTYPERTSALLIDGTISLRRTEDYPWEMTEEELEAHIAAAVAKWGEEEGIPDMMSFIFGEDPAQHPPLDAAFVTWMAKFLRHAETPASYEAFLRMWFETDVRHVLPSVHVPTAVLYKADDPDPSTRDWAAYPADRIPGAVLVAVPGAAWVPWVEEPGPLVSAIEHFLASVREEEVELDRVLATVLFTDVVGSTQRAVELGDARWKELLERHSAAVRALLARYRGTEVKTMGDGFLATFDGAARAVRCAQGICEAVKPLGLEVRAGCHTGEIELAGSDVGGIAVHIGARVGALAGPSEVLVSSTVKDLVAGSGLSFADRGEHELKGVPGSWRLYAAEPVAV